MVRAATNGRGRGGRGRGRGGRGRGASGTRGGGVAATRTASSSSEQPAKHQEQQQPARGRGRGRGRPRGRGGPRGRGRGATPAALKLSAALGAEAQVLHVSTDQSSMSFEVHRNVRPCAMTDVDSREERSFVVVVLAFVLAWARETFCVCLLYFVAPKHRTDLL